MGQLSTRNAIRNLTVFDLYIELYFCSVIFYTFFSSLFAQEEGLALMLFNVLFLEETIRCAILVTFSQNSRLSHCV